MDASAVGVYQVKFNITDSTGNKATEIIRTVNVKDLTAPVIALAGDAEVTHEGGADYTDAGATVTDNLDSDVELVVVNPVDVSKLGEYTITYNAVDAAGNASAEITRKVTVVDTTKPVITLTDGTEIIHQAGIDFIDPGALIADNIDVDLEATVVGTVDKTTLGEYTLTYNVTDSTGNVADEVTRKVTVADSTAPVITLKGDAEMAHEAGTDYTDAGAEVTDNFDTELEISVVNPVDKDQPGTYNITYNLTDAEGNAAVEVVRKVVVADTLVPVLTLNGDAEVTHEVNTDYSDLGATVADSFDTEIEIVVADSVDSTKLGDYTITYNASDDAGNDAIELSRKVTVVDSTGPVITLIGDAEVTYEGGTEYLTPEQPCLITSTLMLNLL